MEGLKEQVEQNILDTLDDDPNPQLELEMTPGGRVTGSVISASFEGMDQMDRQEFLRTPLRQLLGPDYQNVGVILLYTPNEIAVMHEA